MTIYRGLDQAALDREYDTRGSVLDFDRYRGQRARASERVRRTFPCRLDVPYGSSENERLDIFPAEQSGAPVEIYFHGGYWRAGSKDDAAFLAETFVPAGITLVAVDYSLAPQASLDEMVTQARTAIGWIHRNASSFDADPSRLHISGHSAGAHLAAMLLSTKWSAEHGLPVDVIKSACLTSGLFDLEPIRHSFVNEWTRLDRESAHRHSPIHHLPEAAGAATGPLVIAVGERETAEFRRQTTEYRAAWERAGHRSCLIAMPEHHHYSLMVELSNRSGPLAEAVLAQILT